MTGPEAIALSGRSETWLRRHKCAWCDETLWRALVYGCGAMGGKCDPIKKCSPNAKVGKIYATEQKP